MVRERKLKNFLVGKLDNISNDRFKFYINIIRLGFEAPANYNLSDFYIQTLAVVAYDRETSLERVEVISFFLFNSLEFKSLFLFIVYL